jgi:hypothetical protein
VDHHGGLLPAQRAHAGEDHGRQVDLTQRIELQGLGGIVAKAPSDGLGFFAGAIPKAF